MVSFSFFLFGSLLGRFWREGEVDTAPAVERMIYRVRIEPPDRIWREEREALRAARLREERGRHVEVQRRARATGTHPQAERLRLRDAERAPERRHVALGEVGGGGGAE